MANARQNLPENIQSNRTICRFRNLLAHFWGNVVSYFQLFRPHRYKSGKNNTIPERQLESIGSIDNSSILSSSKDVHRRNNRISRSKKTEEAREKARGTITDTEEGREVMPTKTLLAQHYLYFTYNFSSYQIQGWLKKAIIKFYVESEFPVDTHVVDQAGFQNFQNGLHFNYFGGFMNTTQHRQEIRVPHEGDWYLIIKNNGYNNTAIHYEVS